MKIEHGNAPGFLRFKISLSFLDCLKLIFKKNKNIDVFFDIKKDKIETSKL